MLMVGWLVGWHNGQGCYLRIGTIHNEQEYIQYGQVCYLGIGAVQKNWFSKLDWGHQLT